MSGPWLISARHDLAFVLGPLLLAGLAGLLLPPVPLSAPLFWLLVVGIDVAHTWGTLYRAWLDPRVWGRRRRLLLGVAGACLAATSAVCVLAPGWFWTLLAYVAVWHFVRQQVGIAALYRAKSGPTSLREARVEGWALSALCLWPVLWWHVHLPRNFHWFTEGDFLTGLPAWVLWPAGVAGATAVVAHLGLRLRSGRAAWGRDLWMLGTGLVWSGGIVASNGDLPFTASNVVAHGVPYLALVEATRRRRRRLAEAAGEPVPAFAAWPTVAALLLLLACAAAEELAWDALVWREQLFGGEPSALAVRLGTALLALPQLTHYLLDGYAWRTRDAAFGGRAEILGD